MNLAIDIGNSTLKYGIFDKSELIRTSRLADISSIAGVIREEEIKHAIFSSVKANNKTLKKHLDGIPFIEFSHQTSVPVKNTYQSQPTLGPDRLAATIGARKLYPEKDILCIDCGTCITYDYLEENTYRGGAISPGINMKLQAVHNFTDKLPLVNNELTIPGLIGVDTATSIQSGVINGTIHEINETIKVYRRINNNLAVILTGGDASWLKIKLKNVDSVEPNLVLTGLNEILKYNT